MRNNELYYKLTSIYSQPHRVYHNMNHINGCLAQLTNLEPRDFSVECDPDLFYAEVDKAIIAIWFHDVVYNPYETGGLNESASASFFIDEVLDMNAIQLSSMFTYGTLKNPKDFFVCRREISDAIMATACHTIEQADLTFAQKLVLDVDLSGLGATHEIYFRNSDKIRQECEDIPDDIFDANRCKFLEGMLRRENIFYTKYFRSRFQEQAISNMRLDYRYIAGVAIS